MKPHKGTITNYEVVSWNFADGEHMVIIGTHDSGKRIRTSPIVMLSAYEVETENSRYSLGEKRRT